LREVMPVLMIRGISNSLVLCGRLMNVRGIQRDGLPPGYVSWISLCLKATDTASWRIAWEYGHEYKQASQGDCPWWAVLEGFRIVDTPDGCKVYW
jgi:hypothetical protein